MSNETSTRTELEDAIVQLNSAKIKKPDEELVIKMNDLQRDMEAEAGVTAVELDDTYNVE